MRGILVRQWSDPLDLVITEVPSPQLRPGCVRIAVHASGVNFADALMVQGNYQEKPPLPFIPGFEVAGEVIEIAPDVSTFGVGDRVFACLDNGGYAEEVVAHVNDVFPMPQGMDFATAAAMPVAYGTSEMALNDRARLQSGEWLLVHGAAGGVGLTAVEIGKAMGATVIATAGGADRLAVAAEHGADHLIDYKSEDIRERVKAITGGRGVDVAYDPVGGATFEASMRCTRWDGRLVVIGFAGGTVQQIPANHLLVKNLTVIGFYWGGYRKLDPERIRTSFENIGRFYEQGKLKPRVSHTFPLDQAADALRTLKDRSVTGKAVLKVR